MDGYGKRLLVVDDAPDCRVLLAAQLEQAGYAVHTANDGVAGADEMRKRHFDAVIATDPMPEFSSLEFIEFCEIAWPGTPVILLSDDPHSFTLCATQSAGAFCIQTPYEMAILLNALLTVTHKDSRVSALVSMAQM